MNHVSLNNNQLQQKKHLQEIVSKFHKHYQGVEKLESTVFNELYREMAKTAHDLHTSLDPKPKHHAYMIKNRGVSPEDPFFYEHIHPVEDLLAWLEDPKANDDPVDQTVGKTFKMNIYTRRWGHEDKYSITRTEEGWYIEFNSRRGKCNKGGNPVLYEILDHDGVNYPESLPGYLEWLWQEAHEQGLTEQEVQKSLHELANWVNLCESNSPTGIFRGYK